MLSPHTYTGGAALDVIGLSAANTLAVLTPDSDVYDESAEKLLKADADGGLRLDHIDVGYASGATAGQIFASGKLVLSGVTDAWLEIQSLTIPDGQSGQLTAALSPFGFMLVMNATYSYMAIFVLNGGWHTTLELSDPSSKYSITPNTLISNNIFWYTDRYWLQNKMGAQQTYRILYWRMDN